MLCPRCHTENREGARIVDAIETLHRNRLGEQIERLAHHAVPGELREKAVPYNGRGDRGVHHEALSSKGGDS